MHAWHASRSRLSTSQKSQFFTLLLLYRICSTQSKQARYCKDTRIVTLNPPPQGLGSENCAAPAMWFIVSTPLMNYLRTAVNWVDFKYYLSEENHSVGYWFFYNSTIIKAATSPNTPTEYTLEIAQRGLDIVSGTARATVGQIRLHKIKLYCLEFIWYSAGTWRLTNNETHLSPPYPIGR